MYHRLHRHIHSFRFAWEGLVHTIKNEPNFIIHLILSLLAVFLSSFLKISKNDLLAIVIMITLGLAAELVNTAIEEIADLITKEWREEVRIAKDVSAAMVLVVAAGSIIVASIVFLPYLIAMYR